MKISLICAWLLTAALAIEAPAAVMTFADLSGDTGDPFDSAYEENGLSLAPVTGWWLVAQVGGKVTGNPLPAIYGDTYTASLELTDGGGGSFAFSSIDIGNTFFDGLADQPVSYTIEGLLGGQTVFSTSGEATTFTTVVSPSAAAIDTLRISMVRLHADGYAIDNINVTSVVPEPASAVLWGSFFVAVAAYRRWYCPASHVSAALEVSRAFSEPLESSRCGPS